jgi:hypothetical protein
VKNGQEFTLSIGHITEFTECFTGGLLSTEHCAHRAGDWHGRGLLKLQDFAATLERHCGRDKDFATGIPAPSLFSVVPESPGGVDQDSHSAFDSERPADTSAEVAEFHDCGGRQRQGSFADLGSRLLDMREVQWGGKAVHQKR